MPRMGLTPDKVVGAAARLADEVGIHELSLSALAATLGVRVPSLYKHVGGLDDLQQRLAAQGATGLTNAVESALGGRRGRSALTSVSVAFRNYAAQNRGCYQALSRANGRRPGGLTRVDAVLRRVAASYGLNADEARSTARAIHSALHGLVTLEAGGALGADPDASFRELLAVLDRGIASGPQARSRFRLALPGRGDGAAHPR